MARARRARPRERPRRQRLVDELVTPRELGAQRAGRRVPGRRRRARAREVARRGRVPREPERVVDVDEHGAHAVAAAGDHEALGPRRAANDALRDARQLDAAGVQAPRAGAVLARQLADGGAHAEAREGGAHELGHGGEALGGRAVCRLGEAEVDRVLGQRGRPPPAEAHRRGEAVAAGGGDGGPEAAGEPVEAAEGDHRRRADQPEGRRRALGDLGQQRRAQRGVEHGVAGDGVGEDA